MVQMQMWFIKLEWILFQRLYSLKIHSSSLFQKRSFKDYASVFPLAPVGLVPDHKMYKHVWGAAEVACGSMIVFGKNKNKRKGCVGLLVMMALQTQAKLCLGEYLGALVPVCIGAAVGGLYLFLKVEDIQEKKEKAEEKEKAEGKDE